MKILMLVNWKVHIVSKMPIDKQSADYCIRHEDYWFFKYFKNNPDVDIIDVSGVRLIDHIERNNLHFHLLQGLKAIPKLKRYDLIISHGMTTAVIVALWRKIFPGSTKHIVFDIGCFNSAAEQGRVMRLMQYVSKSIDGIIYHTKCQGSYYEKYYPWLVGKSRFVRFGTDPQEFSPESISDSKDKNTYIVCIGYTRRDWKTMISAYEKLQTTLTLRIIGHVSDEYINVKGVEQLPYIPIDELKKQIYNALFCVLPLQSFNYSYGQMTLLQQMAFGKCVITPNVPSFQGYVIDGVNSLIYEPENVSDLVDKLKWAIENKAEIEQIGKQARHFLFAECNEQIMAEQVELFIEEVMSK